MAEMSVSGGPEVKALYWEIGGAPIVSFQFNYETRELDLRLKIPQNEAPALCVSDISEEVPAGWEELAASNSAALAEAISLAPISEPTIGEHLQKWLLRNEMGVDHDLFVSAVNLAFKNEHRRRLSAAETDQVPVNRRDTRSIPVLSGDSASATASTAT